nr:DELTA-thalatoxin-Avl1a-like isoform X2 [Anas platyrhynchos]|eukprot:XP_027304174.1 DELTA-thalatoxin-Avl1a-like [Anas platyrhynchos]
MAAKKEQKCNNPKLQPDLESLMGNIEVCRSVGVEIINNTKNVTLEDFRSYCFSGNIQILPPFEIGPQSVGVCIFAKTRYSLRGSVGVLVCKASSFSLAIMFSNPFDYVLYSIEFALELFKTENHMVRLHEVFSRMMERKSYDSSTLFQRATLASNHETLEVSSGNIRVRARMSNSSKAILKVQVDDIDPPPYS